MKLAITEEFLWKLYNTVDAGIDTLKIFPLHSKTRGLRLDSFLGNSRERKRQFENAVYYMKRKGYITVKSLKGVRTAFLTKDGFNKALKISFKSSERIKRKDGKWIMLIFDMPAKYKKARKLMRNILQSLGYEIFQHSVWITPYDVFEKTERLLQYYSLEKYVKIFLIEQV